MKTAGRYPRFFTSDGRDSVAPAILQRNGDEDGGPKGAELLCNRG